ncbi:hypothetical protein BT69DRAFT_1296175 [Atractiella rhizophila]|nr:hypothetical protein BT69DRAFT_1296175 [Atractiella rhizophila]
MAWHLHEQRKKHVRARNRYLHTVNLSRSQHFIDNHSDSSAIEYYISSNVPAVQVTQVGEIVSEFIDNSGDWVAGELDPALGVNFNEGLESDGDEAFNYQMDNLDGQSSDEDDDFEAEPAWMAISFEPLRAVLWKLIPEMGMANAPKAALPSKESMRIFAEKMRAVGVGAETKEYRGHHGNLVYLNDMPAMIAEELLTRLTNEGLQLCSEPDIVTRAARESQTVIDLVFLNTEAESLVERCLTSHVPEFNHGSDHFPILTLLTYPNQNCLGQTGEEDWWEWAVAMAWLLDMDAGGISPSGRRLWKGGKVKW